MRFLLGFFLLSVALLGVELSFDTLYKGPAKLTVTTLGVSMGLPPHWQAVAKKGEGLKLFQDNSSDTIVLHSEKLSKPEALHYLSTPHYIDEDMKIFPQKRIVKISSRIYRRVYTTNGGTSRPAFLLYIVLGPQNRAVTVTVKYNRKHENSIKATSMSLVQALSFTPTKQLQFAQYDIEQRLKGVHFSYMKRDGAYDEKRELWLCSNKRYLIIENRTVAGGMSRVKEQKMGSWSVDGSKLILQGDDGLDRFIEVKIDSNALFFDGVRSFELKNHKCQ